MIETSEPGGFGETPTKRRRRVHPDERGGAREEGDREGETQRELQRLIKRQWCVREHPNGIATVSTCHHASASAAAASLIPLRRARP